MKDDVDLKANDSDVVKKTDISTTIDKTSTDDTVPTNKAVYDNVIRNSKIKTYTSLANIGLPTNRTATLTQIFSTLPDESILIAESKTIIASDLPNDYGMIEIIKLNISRPSIKFIEKDSGYIHIMGITHDGKPTGNWRKIPTTSVADVPKTRITFSANTNYEEKATSIYSNYEVADGICYVLIYAKCLAPTNSWISINNSLPRPKRFVFKSLNALANATDSLNCTINEGGTMSLRSGTANGEYITTFSYHVKES